MPYEPPPELAALSLSEIAQQVADRKLPAIDGWKPERTGDSRMRIAADGTWFHDDSRIARPGMVRAFSSLLTCDDNGAHWLMTPFEKLSIDVEDAAFMAVDVKREGDALAFRLNTDELVIADADHPLTATGDADTPALYLAVRHGCRARLNRSTYAQLADIALAADSDGWTVASSGQTFSLRP
ncbi:MAG: DUF1285 domain-containing protein [Parerythrobacter sp.]